MQETQSNRWGGAVFGVAMGAFGVMNLARRDMIPGIQPLPDWVPLRAAWAVLSGVLLLAAGAALASGRARRVGALGAAGVLTAWLVVLHLPRFVVAPTDPGVWVPAAEVLALATAAWALVAALAGRDAPAARLVFGATFLVFALSHALYLGYVESVIPRWLPAPRFWAIATGLAHGAAGVALLAGVRARLAARLLALMFGSWVVLLHAPRVAANPEPREWGSLLVALAMCGASWIVAGTLGAERAPAARPVLRAATR